MENQVVFYLFLLIMSIVSMYIIFVLYSLDYLLNHYLFTADLRLDDECIKEIALIDIDSILH